MARLDRRRSISLPGWALCRGHSGDRAPGQSVAAAMASTRRSVGSVAAISSCCLAWSVRGSGQNESANHHQEEQNHSPSALAQHQAGQEARERPAHGLVPHSRAAFERSVCALTAPVPRSRPSAPGDRRSLPSYTRSCRPTSVGRKRPVWTEGPSSCPGESSHRDLILARAASPRITSPQSWARQSGQRLGKNCVSMRSREYASTPLQRPSSSRMLLQLTHMGRLPLKALISSSASSRRE